jgi:CheY-like chemotaxis protein
MKVLVVEDDDEKLSHLSHFLSERFPAANIGHARSLQSGLREIYQNAPDLILLDMTMRNFDLTPDEEGGRPHPFAGKEILRQMQRQRLQIPTIVVTHFARFGDDDDFMTLEDLKKELEGRFSNYIGTVQYKSNVDSWKATLAEFINRVMQERGLN